jgi:hypothetical protein
MLPFAVLYFITSILIGNKKATIKTGKLLMKFAAAWLETVIPKMNDQYNFIDFKNNIIKNFKMYKTLYDTRITTDSNGIVEFKILNCPFTTALSHFGVKNLCKYACAGDFVVAKKNKSNWKFSRTHSHGTDGECCNPTYSKLKE